MINRNCWLICPNYHLSAYHSFGNIISQETIPLEKSNAQIKWWMIKKISSEIIKMKVKSAKQRVNDAFDNSELFGHLSNDNEQLIYYTSKDFQSIRITYIMANCWLIENKVLSVNSLSDLHSGLQSMTCLFSLAKAIKD